MKTSIKLLVISAISLMVVSCVSIPKPAYMATVTYIDYSEITKQTGVFITEAPSISQNYEGLGSLTAFVQDGYEVSYSQQANDTIYDPLYGKTIAKKKGKIKYGDFKYASPLAAVQLAANKAKAMGANGIINLQIKPMSGERTAYLVTGMAVRIQR